MRFNSKVDWWCHAFFWGFMALTFYLTYNYLMFQNNILFFIVLVCLIMLIAVWLPVYASSYYKFEDEFLYVKFGLFFRLRIPYIAIQKAGPSKDLSISYALSLDRLQLGFLDAKMRRRHILVSPEDHKKFLEQLVLKNPFIDVNCGQTPLQSFAPTAGKKKNRCKTVTRKHKEQRR